MASLVMATSESKVQIVVDMIVTIPITMVVTPAAKIQINSRATAVVFIVPVVPFIVISAIAIVAAPLAITPIAVARTAISDCFNIAVGHVRIER